MPLAVELLVLSGVGGCGWPSSMSMVRIGTACCAFICAVVVSASAADPITGQIVLHSTCMLPLSLGFGFNGGGGGFVDNKWKKPDQISCI